VGQYRVLSAIESVSQPPSSSSVIGTVRSQLAHPIIAFTLLAHFSRLPIQIIMGPSNNNIDLKNIDPHRLDSLNQRMLGPADQGGIESSFTPPRSSISNLTDGGVGDNTNNNSSLAPSLMAAVSGGEASHSSCQTVHHANFMSCGTSNNNNNNKSKKEHGNAHDVNVAGSSVGHHNSHLSCSSTSNKKKSTPSKRPVSAIGIDTHNHRLPVTPIRRSKKGGGDSTAATAAISSGSSGQKKLRTNNSKQQQSKMESGSKLGSLSAEPVSKMMTESMTNTTSTANAAVASISTTTTDQTSRSGESRVAAAAATGSTSDQTSRSESRDTLLSYFRTNTNSNHSPSRSASQSQSQFSSPPALQSKSSSSKEKMGSQRTLHSFLGINNKKSDKIHHQASSSAPSEEDGGKKKKSKSVVKDAANSCSESSANKQASSEEVSCTKKKKKSSSLNRPTADASAQSSLPHEQEVALRRHHAHQLSTLQKQLEEAHARNNSIKNNQTLISTNLQRQLKMKKAELDDHKKETLLKMNRAMEVMEKLVKEESVREDKELRQKLASDGARLGRLVSSRVTGGMVGMGMRSQMIESWEDGHAPKMIKMKRGELRKKKEGLVRRREELRLMMSSADYAGSASATVTASDGAGNSELSQSSNTHDSGFLSMMNNDLDRMEANETVRMHLEEVKKKEVELDGEERALNIEKRGHVRKLKLVANEDSSKFRGRRKLHDRYVLMNLLGKGGFSEVWRAFDLQTMHHVAVKIHQLESSWSDAKKENYTKHVSREYEIHREVRHPRIVSLFDVFEIDTDSFATVLECCQGTDLDTLLKDRGRLVERDGRAILFQILSGMRYLSAPSADGRRQGIIHYDLKPGNILFDEQGNAKITDFGLSKIVDTAEEGDSMELTSQGAGTYWYLPPECFMMDQDVRISNKVDVWSIGVIYYQMLFGRRPFGDGQSQDHILRNQTMLHATEVHFPSKPSITEEGKAFIRDCLTYDQMSRPNMSQICEHGYMKLTTL